MRRNLEAARRPLASLLSKSEKALQKLQPGIWQYTMLKENIRALRVATPLLFDAPRQKKRNTLSELQKAAKALTAMIRRSVDAQANFEPGTSPHTMQRNRIKALRLAKKITAAELKRLQA